MASNDRQAEETRIRRALVINSFDLAALEKYLEQAGYIPNSTDEQAVRDSVFKLRQDFLKCTPTFERPPRGSLHKIFEPVPEVGQGRTSTVAQREAARLEAESTKCDAVRDLIRMLAVRKAQASTAEQQPANQGAEVI